MPEGRDLHEAAARVSLKTMALMNHNPLTKNDTFTTRLGYSLLCSGAGRLCLSTNEVIYYHPFVGHRYIVSVTRQLVCLLTLAIHCSNTHTPPPHTHTPHPPTHTHVHVHTPTHTHLLTHTHTLEMLQYSTCRHSNATHLQATLCRHLWWLILCNTHLVSGLTIVDLQSLALLLCFGLLLAFFTLFLGC